MATGSFPCSGCKKECLSELVGTYCLVLIGPGAVITVSMLPGIGSITALSITALAFGSTVATIILLFGNNSAHINPAVTLAHILSKLTRRGLVIPYFSFQILGGLLAGLTLRVAFGSWGSGTSLGSTKLAFGVNPTVGIVLEALGTCILSLSALIATSRMQSRKFQAVAVGGTLVILILMIGSFTGASFNPARSLGPSVASAYFVDQYVYWIGPLLGGAIGAFIFRLTQTWSKSNDGRRELPLCLC